MFHNPIPAVSGWPPGSLIGRFRLYARTGRLSSVLIFGSVLVRKCGASVVVTPPLEGVMLPLGPLVRGLVLHRVGQAFATEHVFYVRHMDRVPISVARTANRTLRRQSPEHPPGRTFVGQVENGSDFLGYHFHRGAHDRSAACLSPLPAMEAPESRPEPWSRSDGVRAGLDRAFVQSASEDDQPYQRG